MTDHFLISCEHGGNRIPARYRPLLADSAPALRSHRGYDPGALALARDLAAALAAPLIVSTTSRLLVDLNRSPGHPRLHSEPARRAPPALRREIFEHCYLPYRDKATAAIAAALARGGRVIHISSHSFTPVLDGEVRRADIGLLYDPSRAGEAELCRRWQPVLARLVPGLKVRRNYPYRGISDGLCAWLRRHFAAERYVGVELEINQTHVLRGGPHWRNLRKAIVAALGEALGLQDAAGGPVAAGAAWGTPPSTAGDSSPAAHRAAHRR